MTWKQFKDFLEENGVKDDMLIDYIDITGFNILNEDHVVIKDNEFHVW